MTILKVQTNGLECPKCGNNDGLELIKGNYNCQYCFVESDIEDIIYTNELEDIWNDIRQQREKGIKEDIINEKYHNDINDDLLHDMLFLWKI